METITIKITPRLTHELDDLIKKGWYANRSEAIRDAIRRLIELRRYKQLKQAIEEDIHWGLYGED